jgi:hypothetical protein
VRVRKMQKTARDGKSSRKGVGGLKKDYSFSLH